MDIRPRIRNVALVGALAAVAATAWATNESMTTSSYTPATTTTVTVNDSLAPTESVVTTNDTLVATSEPSVAAPVEDRGVTQPGITIEERRLSNDERIQQAVMDTLANNPRIYGKIGVESNDAVVRLSGYTTTPGMAWRAARDAQGVIGVKYVRNEIRPRVGGSV